MPFQVARDRERRQARASDLSLGCAGTGHHRVLSAKAMKTKNKTAAENLDSKLQPSQSPKKKMCFRFGSCHNRANDHRVPSEKNAMAVSVMTNAPKVKNKGLLTKTVSESRPPQSPPSSRPNAKIIQPRARVSNNMGKRVQASTMKGSFQRVMSQRPEAVTLTQAIEKLGEAETASGALERLESSLGGEPVLQGAAG